MTKILNISACMILLIVIPLVIYGVRINSSINLGTGLIIIGICSIVAIIEFSIASIIANQEKLFKEIREQNSVLYKIKNNINQEQS